MPVPGHFNGQVQNAETSGCCPLEFVNDGACAFILPVIGYAFIVFYGLKGDRPNPVA